MTHPHDNPRWLVPLGTQVVLRRPLRDAPDGLVEPAGAVGLIIRCPADPDHAYRVRLVTGGEVSLRRGEFDLLREHQRAGLSQPGLTLRDYALDRYIIYRCVIGSQAYGLAGDASDVDRRGIYLPPAEAHWSLFGVPAQLEDDATQECYWELQKFLTLALKANPNVLECLYSPLVELATPLAEELRSLRQAFLSRLIYQTYNGYVLSQFRKLEQDLRTRGQLRWKHAMHLIRLLLSGVAALRTGEIPVRVDRHRDELLAIRAGRMPWEEVERWRLALHADFDAALAATKLPDRPDYDRANRFLIAARRQALDIRPEGSR